MLENFRPGVLEALGFSWYKLGKINPKLILCSITGYGQDGPSVDETAFDIIIQARSGLMSVTGERDGHPVKLGIPIVDIGAGMYAGFAILSALHLRSRTGEGSKVDVSMMDSAVSWLCYWVSGYSVAGKELTREGNAHPTIAPYQLFRTRDGTVALAVTRDKLWRKFVKSFDRREMLDERFADNPRRVKHRAELVEILMDLISGYTTKQFVNLMSKQGIPCAPLQGIKEVVNDSQVVHRKMILEMERVLVPGCPIKIDSLTT